MKRFVWFAGLAGALTFAPALHAIPVKSTAASQPLYSIALDNPKSAAPSPGRSAPVTVTSQGRNASPITPMLSSLVLGQNSGRSAAITSKFGYTPQPLNLHYVPKTTTKPTPTKSGAPPPVPGDPVRVPDGGDTASLLGIALLGTVLVKRTELSKSKAG
jgi:hypothetical protein